MTGKLSVALKQIVNISLLMLLIAVPAFAAVDSPIPKGRLYLVSAGIGDPDNITIRAQKTIEQADIVFAMKGTYDHLGDLLKGKEIHEAGHALFSMGHDDKIQKSNNSRKSVSNKMMRKGISEEQLAAEREKVRNIVRNGIGAGKNIVVLDYGDPTIYSPQIGYMREFADLKPVIVPGISSFNAASAALGRELVGGISNGIILTSACNGCGSENPRDSLKKLAKSRSTMVFFTMGLDLPEVVRQLKTGYPGTTPIAIVSHAGFKGKEAVLYATLDTVVEKTQGRQLHWQHLIYVGDFLK